jgi:hypothetical protein
VATVALLVACGGTGGGGDDGDAGLDGDVAGDPVLDTAPDPVTDTIVETDAGPDAGPRHDFLGDMGGVFGMGAAIFGDAGTSWVQAASAAPHDVDWTFGYMYASGDPHDDLDGFEWIVGYRLDTAQGAGAQIPTVTFYRMLGIGEDHGYGGTEAQIVQQMLGDPDAVHEYLEDFVVLLDILDGRETPVLVHVELDSWGFMMWAFDGFDHTSGNPDASAVPVALSAAAHPALEGYAFTDDAGGLGRAMLHLRDEHAPDVRMGWHASNFRVGTRPEVVTGFYSSMGAWDVIVTEPPHMVDSGSSAWDTGLTDNANNLAWLDAVSFVTGLAVLVWQAYVDDAAPYIGAWPDDRSNLEAFAQRGVVGVLWDPNGLGAACGYDCAEADDLLEYLSSFSSDPLLLPE